MIPHACCPLLLRRVGNVAASASWMQLADGLDSTDGRGSGAALGEGWMEKSSSSE